MDPELKQAACLGDIEFLKRAVATKSTDYFLSYCSSQYHYFIDSEMIGNIFHLAAKKDKVDFMREAMKLLPNHVVLRLLCQQDDCDRNPLHVAAAQKACFEPVGLILGFYKSLSEDDDNHDKGIEKPWLALNEHNRTPLHIVLSGVKNTEDNEECALEILSMDSLESFCNTVDSQGNSPLFYAVKNGFSRVSEEILKSSSSYSTVSGAKGSTPLHFAPNSSENVLRLLLEKHPDMVDEKDTDGLNVVHQWAKLNKIWPFNFLKKGGFPGISSKIFIDLIKSTTEEGESPLHTVAETGNIEIGQELVQGHQREIEARNQSTTPPWKLRNTSGETPFIVAIGSRNVELALYFLSIDKTLCQIHTTYGWSPLLYAVYCCNSYGEVVEEILSIQEPHFGDLRGIDGLTVLHGVRNCPEDIGTMLVEKYWWMMNLIDDSGKTALDYAKEEKASWLVRLLKNPSLIQKQPFDWVTACQQNETWAVVAFVDTCQDLHKVCREKQDTPLHHITFQTYQECLQFLNKDSIADLKNTTDSEGATPLHRALEREDMYLAKALLADDGVKRNIADHNGITAMDLLAKLCQEDDYWETINRDLKTSYIQSRTNLDQMRTTLSVVAALLATITFAAGFTLPGGLNSETGSAMLAKKASFIVFLLADAYAMCTSILVLFCLIWSMVCDEDMSYVLVDRCVFILMQSLYGSLVAFMTGIYTVINQSKLWVAIVIFIMCSLLGIAANRTILYTILSKLIPASNRDYKKLPSLQKQTTMPKFGIDKYRSRRHQNVEDQTDDDDHDPPLLLLEEGKTSTFGIDMMSHSSEGTSSSHQNHDQEEDGYRLALLEQNGKGTISHQNQDQKEDCLALLEEGKASTSGHDI